MLLRNSTELSSKTFSPSRVRTAAKYVFGPDFDGEPLLPASIDEAIKRFEQQLRSLRKATRRGCRTERCRVFLKSFHARLIAVVLTARARKTHLTFEQAAGEAIALDAFSGATEDVIVRAAPKKSGGYRLVCEFGPRATALQWLVREVIRAWHPVPKREFAASGRGRSRAISHIRACMNDTGSRHIVIADVKNFFPSVSADWVAIHLGLPHSVVVNSIYVGKGAKLHITGDIPTSDTENIEQIIRSGLPQGSLLSPCVAALAMDRLLSCLPDHVPAGSYVDDLFATAKDAEEAEAIKDALLKFASASPIGPLSFKTLEAFRVAKHHRPARYLGYQLRVGADGRVRATPTPKSIANFLTSLKTKLKRTRTKDLDTTFDAAVKAWRAAQDAWDLHEAAEDDFMSQAISIRLDERTRRKELGELKKHGSIGAFQHKYGVVFKKGAILPLLTAAFCGELSGT